MIPAAGPDQERSGIMNDDKPANRTRMHALICTIAVCISAFLLLALPASAKAGAPAASAKTAVPAASAKSGALAVSVKSVNKWTQGNEKYEQISLTLKNPQSTKITSWMLKLDFDRNIKIVNSWCGTYSVSGKRLTIKPASFNKQIPKGGRIEVGFIIKASSRAVAKSLSGTVLNGSRKSYISRRIGAAASPTPVPTKKPTPVPTRKPTPTPTKKPTPTPAPSGKTPVQQYGRLKVKGSSLVSSTGKTVALKGVSTHGINWFPQYVNKAAFKNLRDNWGVQCIRLAMYTEEYNGYCSGGDKSALTKLIQQGVQYATELGMYVIIDWHILSDGNPQKNQAEALKFFKSMSAKYKNRTNVIYEICNEPNGGTSWNTIKSYATKIIKAIRENDKNAIILVGTPTWSQDVDVAAASPITGYSNIMYTFHFYAATHGQSYRQKVQNAIKKGLPVFVSEFGISEASGSGRADTAEGDRWISFLKKNNISYVCWNLSNKNETSALLKPSCTKTSGFAATDLTAQGRWFKNK